MKEKDNLFSLCEHLIEVGEIFVFMRIYARNVPKTPGRLHSLLGLKSGLTDLCGCTDDGPTGRNAAHICAEKSTPAVSVVPFRSNTFSPLKSPSSGRVKGGQVHIFQLRYLKRCGSSAK